MRRKEIRRDLELEKAQGFEKSRLYARVFELTDKVSGTRAPRAVLPQIRLNSQKIRRDLTSEWFANRVDVRYQACLR